VRTEGPSSDEPPGPDGAPPDNVVHLPPRDWLGDRTQLVPFGLIPTGQPTADPWAAGEHDRTAQRRASGHRRRGAVRALGQLSSTGMPSRADGDRPRADAKSPRAHAGSPHRCSPATSGAPIEAGGSPDAHSSPPDGPSCSSGVPSAQAFWSAASPLLHTPIRGPAEAPSLAATTASQDLPLASGTGARGRWRLALPSLRLARASVRLARAFGRLEVALRRLEARPRRLAAASALTLVAALGIIGLLNSPRQRALAARQTAPTAAAVDSRSTHRETDSGLGAIEEPRSLPSVTQALSLLGATLRGSGGRSPAAGGGASKRNSALRARSVQGTGRRRPHSPATAQGDRPSRPAFDARAGRQTSSRSSPTASITASSTGSSASTRGSGPTGASASTGASDSGQPTGYPAGGQTPATGSSSPTDSAATNSLSDSSATSSPGSGAGESRSDSGATTTPGPIGPGAPFGPGYAN